MDTEIVAEIVTIGDELNRGEILDSNSSWLAERLTDLGAHVRWRSSVNDHPGDMEAALRQAAARAALVVATGGLGPTEDDRTVDVVARLLGVEPATDPEHDARMRARFAERNFTLTPNNLRQVRLPTGARVLVNRHGLAPGFGVRLGAAELYFMPGIPREMKPMFEDELVPCLGRLLGTAMPQLRRTFRIAGMGESHVDHALSGLLDGIPDATLHYRVAFPENLVTVVVRRPERAAAEAVLATVEAAVRTRLGNAVYGIGGETLAQVVGRCLVSRQATLATAESCTGGLVGELITAVPGASAWYRGGVVSYANETKVSLLGVRPQTLAAHGAVSAECVREMVVGARRALGASCAVAVSGVAGPGGGTPEKPVGTVFVAAGLSSEAIEVRKIFWPGTREQVRQLGATAALQLLHKVIT